MGKAYTPDVASANTGMGIKQPGVPGGMPASVAPSPGKLTAKASGISNVARGAPSSKAPPPTHVYPVRTGGAGFTQHAASTGGGVPKMNAGLKVGKF